jgi:hypothetical protein
MGEISPLENASSLLGSSVSHSPPDVVPTRKPSVGFSFGRLGVLFVVAAMAWGLGFIMAPPEAVLLEPKDDDLVVLNGCVISACSYMASVRAQNKMQESFWSRVMLVRYRGQSAGHAYCVWETDGHIFGYDRAGGSFPIPGRTKDATSIAIALASGLEKVLQKPMLVERAEFIEPKQAKLYVY